MAVENRIQFYGISIESNEASPRFYGISIDTNNFFNGKLIVVDENGANISGATVTITSTQTNPKNYAGDLILTTDSNGMCEPTGSSTTGTTLKIEKTGYTTYEGSMNASLYENIMYSIASDPSKRMYVTNRGNIVLNPNNTTLIEIN